LALPTIGLADEFNQGHYCAKASQGDKYCVYLKQIKSPDYSKKSDFQIIPHRGIWGEVLGNGLPENSIEAYERAFELGFPFSEVDIMSTNKKPGASSVETIMNHDYSMRRLTNAGSNVYSFNTQADELVKLRRNIKKRGAYIL
jgi:glycerophosphoryl diester phosphodiesterase